jgi:hypothetical protein
MIQNVLRDLGGVEMYGIISVCLFFATFTGALIWALAQKKATCTKLSALPLEREGKGELHHE